MLESFSKDLRIHLKWPTERSFTYSVFLHNGAAKVRIFASKSRIAPIRVISIPRLELCACVLLAQLVNKIRSTLRLNISDIVLHTDSTIALAWLNTPANRLKTFVLPRCKN
ncbi:integrase catalytic domain-containing protein [Trichonephila clavipes]|nr:integrase catalytic domain-containing protein [Trichonephila clavipes]